MSEFSLLAVKLMRLLVLHGVADGVIKTATSGSRAIGSRPLLYALLFSSVS